MDTVRKYLEKINTRDGLSVDYRFAEPLSPLTTFKIGGAADLYIRLEGEGATGILASLRAMARGEGLSIFVLGGGANIVVSDRGMRGIVLDTGGLRGCSFSEGRVTVRAGTPVDEAIEACAARGLSSLEFLYGMPGTIGGALWMNARCYGASISDALLEVRFLNEEDRLAGLPLRSDDWSYKRSPFQAMDALILEADFITKPMDELDIRAQMTAHRADREAKGHYRLPSAGSSFKNDRAFGKPTGQIIDELGLRGSAVGGARVADWHGNIIVNTGDASAADVANLVAFLEKRVFEATGFTLEPEILFVGDWNSLRV